MSTLSEDDVKRIADVLAIEHKEQLRGCSGRDGAQGKNGRDGAQGMCGRNGADFDKATLNQIITKLNNLEIRLKRIESGLASPLPPAYEQNDES